MIPVSREDLHPVNDDGAKVIHVGAGRARLDQVAEAADAEEQFAIDFAIMTGELSRMIADLMQALGGGIPAAGQYVS